jgi:cytolysin (calcineurin-like family phosphatase)
MCKARITPALRAKVLTRDNHICRACGFGGSPVYAGFLDCDHAVAERNGGETTLDNLQTLCKVCNTHKAKNDWTFPVRVASADEQTWSFNQKVMGAAFHGDTARRLRKLK